ncbi:GyrI-like domain-containing protein [Erysipelothrix urinaevulpis]|uniref:GyrI-like domain-containing protein n=1 Tax=Erysipelothrix urinaevulpis TaxID=2683717 RepID=UPI0013582630|nr:GyrI-like domain-containing protein [Erysipelothrix urinaevulpis]
MKIEVLKNKSLFYKRYIGPYGPENRRHMKQFKKYLDEQNLMRDDLVIIAQALDNPQITNPNLCRYDIGIINVEKDLVKELNEGVINDGNYAVIVLDHTEKAIHEFWRNFPQYLIENDLQFDEKNAVLERYDSPLLKQNLCEILIPIK